MTKDKILIIGSDSFAVSIAQLLYSKKNEIVLITLKNNIDDNKKLSFVESLVIISKIKNEDLLQYINKDISAVFICLPELLNETALLVMELKEKNIKNLYIEVDSNLRYEIFEKIGGVTVVYPGREAALKIIDAKIN